jgi:RHS repeat-associated protein
MTRTKLVFLLLLSCLGFKAFANDPPYTTVLRGSQSEIYQGAAATVQDTAFFHPTTSGLIQSNNKIQNVISFRLNEFSNEMMPDSFRVTIHVDVDYKAISNSTTVQTISDSILVIEYNKYRSYTAKDFLYFNNAVYTSVKITSIQAEYATLSQVTKFLELENEIIVDRDYTLDCSQAAVSSLSINSSELSTKGELLISWAPNISIEEYDLEWTYVDNSSLAAGNYHVSGNLSPDILFRHNATRVSIKNTSYYVPLLYEGGGKLYFRVRGVQYLTYGERKVTNWSPVTSGGFAEYSISLGHEQKLNWQSSISFAEEGKRKAVVQYSDGSLYNRQTVTKDNTTGTTVVAETLYDKQGRPQIQVLPTPTLSSLIKYTPTFNTINSAEYDKDVYDPAGRSCDVSAPGMDITKGASRYYSPNNEKVNEGFHKYIPDAKKFAFTETQYTNDNTGRIARQGGVGDIHQIGGGHETKYYYGTPSQAELDALFGTEAGIASHYQKNMVRDANGQYSVSYVSMTGKTVATALAGDAPASLAPLASNKIRNRTDQLLDPSNNIVNGTVIESVKTILVPKTGNYTFNYLLNPESFELKDCDDTTICYDCLYDLEITITDDCSNGNLPNGVPYTVTKNNFTLGGVDTTCTPALPLSLNFTLTLKEGSYTITKRLKLSQEKMNDYRDSLFLAHNTCRTYEDIYKEVRDSVMNRLGDDCTNDSTTTPSYKQMREQMLFDLTVPFGQYANTDDSKRCSFLSVFNIYTLPKPESYKDENGDADYVFVTRDGQEVKKAPQELTKEEFIDNFKPSWAEALLEYHPEYCLLAKYEKLADSHIWDEDFEKTETFAEALAKGYLNPTASNTGPASNFTVANTKDPLYSILDAAGYTTESQDAELQLNSYLFNVNTGSTNEITAWGFATIAAKCTEEDENQIANSCGHWINNDKVFNTNSLCVGELDMAWRIFRGLYLDKKAEWVDGFIRTNCTDHPFPYNQQEPLCIPNFPKADAMLNAAGLDFSNITSYQQAQNRGQDSLNAIVNRTCEEYASRWYQQLASCNYTQYPQFDSATLINRLIAVCKEGGDINHPFGASTVKLGSSSLDKSFDDVIRKYNLEKSIPYNENCNGYLIDIPKAWESSSILTIPQPTYTKPDSCTCSRISELNTEYNNNSAGYSSLSNYLATRYQTNISQANLDSLLGLCSGAITCKYLAKPILLPVVLQCGGKICVDCDTVRSLYNYYRDSFPNALPAYLVHDNEVQDKKNKLFENFMNSRLGFSKTWYDYLKFMDSCGGSNFQSCDTTWTVYNPGQDLEINADFYVRSFNNIQPYSQHFDGQHFVSPPAWQAGHYVLVNKKDSFNVSADTSLKVEWRVKFLQNGAYVNPIAKTTTSTGLHTWVGAIWQKDQTDTSWWIGTTILNRVGTISTLGGLGLSANSQNLLADYVKVYNSQNQLIYVDQFTYTCNDSTKGKNLLCNYPKADTVDITPDGPCADSTQLITIWAIDKWRAYKDSLTNAFNNAYTQKCLAAANLESFTVTHDVQEYHYTLYYYDQVGNLIKTVPPEGVDESVYDRTTYFDSVTTERASGAWYGPDHGLPTIYRYSSLNQVVTQNSPDGGFSQFFYDRLGRLAISRNAKQRAEDNYSYTMHDALGRITEVGQKYRGEQRDTMSQVTSVNPAALYTWLNNGLPFSQVTRTVYDEVNHLQFGLNSLASTFKQKAYTLRNRVSHTLYYDLLDVNGLNQPLTDDYNSGSFYSYDIHGNVDTLLHDYQVGVMKEKGVNRYKLIAYHYDLISGKVNQVHYQPGERDEFYHRYEYDAENRITDVYTTFKKEFVGQKNLEEHEAFYQYYKHGPLAKTIIGQQQVQGLDYAYSLHGWLKGVNLDGTLDDAIIARDAYNFSLHYYKGDYTAINSTTIQPVKADWMSDFKHLHNGNIGSMAVDIKRLSKPIVYNYKYDQLNRLISMDAFAGWTPANNNQFQPNKLEDYKERVSYDANGNILGYLRHGEPNSSGLYMDSLVYQYERLSSGRLHSNKLRYVYDEIKNNNYAADLKAQTILGTATAVENDKAQSQAGDNYAYDAIGNLIKDTKEGIAEIKWTVYGQIEKITKADNTTISYTYDAGGKRISKTIANLPHSGIGSTTWYVRDAQGNVMAIYKHKNDLLTQTEQHLYGSSRLGIWNKATNMEVALPTPNNGSGLGALNSTSFKRGNKLYELSNHLGNVLTTVTDKKFGVDDNSNNIADYYTADITTAQDYYPFGMLMPGRRGYAVNGGWATSGGENGLPAMLSLNSRSGNTPAEYKATQEIEFVGSFESGTGDVFETFITTDNGNGGTGAGDYSGGEYRYGFNGKENDNEIKGEGNSLDFGARIYDSRISRWLSVDPLSAKYCGQTPYAGYNNSPIFFTDPTGLEGEPPSMSIADKHFWNKKNFFPRANAEDVTTILINPNQQTRGSIQGLYKEALDLVEKTGKKEASVQLTNGQTWRVNSITGKFTPISGEGIISISRAEASALKNFMINVKDGVTAEQALKNMALGMTKSGFSSTIQGGFQKALDLLGKQYGVTDGTMVSIFKKWTPEQPVKSAPAQAAKTAFSGKNISWIKWGQRTFLAVSVAADVYEIYQSDNKIHTITKKVTGFLVGHALGTTLATGAAVGGQLGPQVATPEEIITVPLGYLIGFITGSIIGETVIEKVSTWEFTKIK